MEPTGLWSMVMSSTLMFLKENKDAFSSLGAIGGLIIFAFAVYQYRRGETWKKSEFIAKLYRDFLDDVDCQRAMWMLDWGDRQINFGTDEKPIFEECTSAILVAALRKHDGQGFTTLEMTIRDTFDRFFSYIEQFERAVQNKLVHEKQVYPYFAYWIELLNGKRHLPTAVQNRIWEYVDTYGFKDVKRFVARWSR
jgi:hypothetical protein